LDENVLLGHLEALAHTLGVKIRYEKMDGETAFPRGGLCRIRDAHFIIMNKGATTSEKVETLVGALRRFDLTRVYLRPALRALLEQGTDEMEDPVKK
jgi:hypothetical protein